MSTSPAARRRFLNLSIIGLSAIGFASVLLTIMSHSALAEPVAPEDSELTRRFV